MKSFLIFAAALLAAVDSGADGFSPDFDQGDLTPAQYIEGFGRELPAEGLGGVLGMTWTEDCENVRVPARGAQGSLPAVILTSELRAPTECSDPELTGCTAVMWTKNRSVAVRYAGRHEPYPWESQEFFRVCMADDSVTASARNTSTQYAFRVLQTGPEAFVVEAVGGERVIGPADSRGLESRNFEIEAGPAFVLSVADRWVDYYPAEDGERIEVQVRVYRKDFFADPIVAEWTEIFPTAESYSFRLNSGFREQPRSGREYDMAWRFRRLGAVSNRDWSSWTRSHKLRLR